MKETKQHADDIITFVKKHHDLNNKKQSDITMQYLKGASDSLRQCIVCLTFEINLETIDQHIKSSNVLIDKIKIWINRSPDLEMNDNLLKEIEKVKKMQARIEEKHDKIKVKQNELGRKE